MGTFSQGSLLLVFWRGERNLLGSRPVRTRPYRALLPPVPLASRDRVAIPLRLARSTYGLATAEKRMNAQRPLGITGNFPNGHAQDVSLLAAYRQVFA